MPVLWITVILSLLLAFVFLVLFVKEHGRFHFGSTERAALLPLEEDAPSCKVPSKPRPAPADRSNRPRKQPPSALSS